MNKKHLRKLIRKVQKIFRTAVPFWMTGALVLYSIIATGFIEYYILKKSFDAKIESIARASKNPAELIQLLKLEVLPQKGHELAVSWNDIGVRLMKSGAIDKAKYEDLFGKSQAKDQVKYLLAKSENRMTINEKNAHFMVNTLWALGLVNKNKVLDEGTMKNYSKGDIMGFASTGGWTLGEKPTAELYSSEEIIKLTSAQEEQVKKIAQNVYRPCCDNSTEFPDCNHGMAALAYIEAAVSQGVSERRIYRDLLALNSFWFPRQYVEIAMYMYREGTDWEKADPKIILSSKYSSATGAQKVRESLQADSGSIGVSGGGCGV